MKFIQFSYKHGAEYAFFELELESERDFFENLSPIKKMGMNFFNLPAFILDFLLPKNQSQPSIISDFSLPGNNNENRANKLGIIFSFLEEPRKTFDFLEYICKEKFVTDNFAQKLKEAISYKIKMNDPFLLVYPESNSNYQSSNTLFEKNNTIKLLIEAYALPDFTQASLEKGLRNAAGNNKIKDLKEFITLVENIDAQDINPKVKRTALHWAAIKGYEECYKLLQEAGANSNIIDAQGKTALDYLKPSESFIVSNHSN